MNSKQFFKTHGYYFVPKIVKDPENLFCPVPPMRGQMVYFGNSLDKFQYIAEEQQVKGSLSRYNIPIYKDLHFLVKKEIEHILDMDLYPTYFYDRFYFEGQELVRHTDRPSCEISVTLQISTNLKNPWEIWFETYKGNQVNVSMNNGDACIYRGMDLPHWRNPMKSRYNKIEQMYRKIKKLEDDTYLHQIFLHYVDANGPCLQHAFDRIN